jgi:hypothetical protein
VKYQCGNPVMGFYPVSVLHHSSFSSNAVSARILSVGALCRHDQSMDRLAMRTPSGKRVHAGKAKSNPVSGLFGNRSASQRR